MVLTHIDLKYVSLIYRKIRQKVPNGKGLMWMRVIARFERVKLGKSADRHLKFWSPDRKF